MGQSEVQSGDYPGEQAPPRLASQPENPEQTEPLTTKISNIQSISEESSSQTETAQIPTKDLTECNSLTNQKLDGNKPVLTISHSSTNLSADRSDKSLLSDYRKIIKARCQIEKKVRIMTREYLHAIYPGIKNIPPRGFKAKIEFQYRARLFWESGIPELMKRSEEIWLELGEEF
jgi:hypothetical protein